jgi:autotransporter-associated beta strand protein
MCLARLKILATTLALLGAGTTRAADLYWDANAATSGQTDGAGAWLGTNQWWTGSTNTNWTSGNSATFGVGGAGGAVTLASPTTVDSLNFNYFTGTYTLGTAGQGITLNDGINKNAGSGAVTMASPITLGGAQIWTNNSATTLQVNTTGVTNAGHLLTIDGTGTTSFGVINNTAVTLSGSGGLTKNGEGRLSLGGTNAGYSGTTTLNGGVTIVNGIGSIGSGNLVLNGGVYEEYWTNTFSRSLGSGAGQVQLIGGASGFSENGSTGMNVNLGGAAATVVWGSAFFNPSTLVLQASSAQSGSTLNFQNGINLSGVTRTIASYKTSSLTSGATISGVISNSTGTAGLNKTGPGILSLTAANTYNGATTLDAGSITLSGSGTINSTNALNLRGGALRLVNTANTQRFADGAAITSTAGGTISYENTSGAVNYTETLGSLAANGGQANIVLATNQTGAGSQTLTFGGLSQSGTGAVTFSATTTGPQTSGNKNMIVVSGSGTTTAGQIIGAWATTGTTAALQTDYAVYDGNYVRASNIAANDDETTWVSTENVNLSTTATLTAARTVNTLRYSGAANNLVLGGNNLETTGLLNGGSGLLTLTSTGGVLTTQTGGGNLYVTTGSAGITSGAAIANNGSDAITLVKSGSAANLILNGVNTYTGDTIINAGVLQVGTNGVANGANLGSGNYAGNIFIGAGASLDFQTNSDQTLSGVISGDGNLLKRYIGTLTLSGDNTYTGKTTLGAITNAGSPTLVVSSFNSVSNPMASSSLGRPTTVANGTIDLGSNNSTPNPVLRYVGTGETTDRVINFIFNSAASRTLDASGPSGVLKFTSAFVSNGTTTGSIVLQGTGAGEIDAGLPFTFTNLTKSGTGTWTLGGVVGSTGTLTISASGGTLALQKKRSLMGGNTANWTAAKVVVNSGATLAVNVGGDGELNNTDVTTLLTNLGGLGGAINNNGLRSGSRIGFDTTNATGGTFTIADNLANPTGTGSGAIGLTKRGTGILALTGTNSYTGPTTVSAGTLLLDGSGSINGSSGVTVANGALLLHNSSVDLTAPLTISAGGSFGGTGEIVGSFVFGSGSSLFVEDLDTPFAVSSGTVSFASTFGIANLAGIVWDDVSPDTYTLIAGTVDDTNLINVGSDNAVDVGGGKSAYFQIGSLQLVVVPEPGTFALLGAGAIAGIALLRRRRG